VKKGRKLKKKEQEEGKKEKKNTKHDADDMSRIYE